MAEGLASKSNGKRQDPIRDRRQQMSLPQLNPLAKTIMVAGSQCQPMARHSEVQLHSHNGNEKLKSERSKGMQNARKPRDEEADVQIGVALMVCV